MRAAGLRKVGLLGTRFTMDEDFITQPLRDAYGLTVLLPEDTERDAVHEIIFKELCLGVIREESRKRYLDIIDELARQGAEGMILGCTEIELLIRPGDTPVRLFPTTRLHALAAVEFALGGET